jgi:hypothetical protein
VGSNVDELQGRHDRRRKGNENESHDDVNSRVKRGEAEKKRKAKEAQEGREWRENVCEEARC